MKLTYRPEIDALRAIAVVGVLIYHAKVHFFNSLLFQGGYYGVDIFFIISGYLITGIIIKEKDENSKFSFQNFYLRRARRILPALLFVIIISLPLAWYSLMPYSFVEYSKSIIYTISFLSNFFFYITGLEYGAVSGLLKPLLHTWSLSVEEQFYIFFPLVLIFLIKFFKKEIFNPILIITFASLIFAQYFYVINQNLNFYFLPSRVWELLFGSLIFIYQKNKTIEISNILSDILCVLGLIFILISFNVFNEINPSPSIKTLIPIIGTALIILFAKKEAVITRLLSNKSITSIGLISYSLYLFHYPIFAFVRSNRLAQGIFEYSIVAIIILGLSILSYYFIEKPFRDKKKVSNHLFLKIIFTAISIIFVLAIVIIKNDGFQKRFPSTKNFSTDYQKYLKESRELKYELGNPKFKYENKKNILVVGNSHGRDTFNALYLNKSLFDKFEFSILDTQINCLEDVFKEFLLCDRKMSNLEKKLLFESEIILISTSFRPIDLNKLETIIDNLKKKKKRVILFSQKPGFYFENYLTLVDEFFLEFKKLPDQEEKKRLEKKYFLTMSDKFNETNLRLKQIADKKNIILFKKEKLFCDDLNKRCEFLTKNNRKIFYDSYHYTTEGAKYLGKKIFQLDWLK